MQNNEKNKNAVKNTVQAEILRDLNKDNLRDAATNEINVLMQRLNSSPSGLDEKEIAGNRSAYGNNTITHEKRLSLTKRIVSAFVNPFTAILFCLALVSIVTDIIIPIYQNTPEGIAPLTVTIILAMVCISGTLRFVQETRSGNAAEKLLSMITTTCTVDRIEGGRQEIPLEDVVAGDIVHLSAGDMVPADLRMIEAKDLFISQSALTGESDPQEKTPHITDHNFDTLTECSNLAFMGSNVISGSAAGIVIATGDNSMFGSMAQAVAGEAVETSFTKGVNAVSWVLIRFMLITVPIVFLINGITKGDWLQAFLFGISI
ncbi:MAG: cation-transporting P-type ATPase, partial [Hungatella sp.]